MKILITAAQFSSNISGIQRHALNMVRCLLKQKDVSEIHFVVAPWQQKMVLSAGLDVMEQVTTHVAPMKLGLLSRNLWYYRSLPHLVAKLQPDILHLTYPVPVQATSIACPIVLSLHDLYPYEIPENFGFPKVLFNRMILQQCLRSAHTIACVSGTTLQSLKQYTQPAVWRKSLRISNCVEAEARCTEHSPISGWQGEPFLLTISQHRRNKNIPLLIRILHRLIRERRTHPETKLVVVGIFGPETERIRHLISELGLRNHVVFLQGLSEASLQWCYQNCRLLAAPSETEGFGLPVAEALLAGCHIVCSDIPAFREIDSKHCHFVTLNHEAERNFTETIVDVMQRPRPAPIPLPQFSANVLGAQYTQVYRKLLAETSLSTETYSDFIPTTEGRS